MGQRTKKLGILSAGILLAMGSAMLPQQAQAYTMVSGQSIGTGSTGTPRVVGNNDVAVGDGSMALSVADTYNGATAVGTSSLAWGNFTAALGTSAQVGTFDFEQNAITGGASNASAFGAYAKAFADNATAVGGSAASYGTGSTAVGYAAICAQIDTVTGSATKAANYATALGSTSQALYDGATAVGYGASAQGEDSIAIGHLSAFTETTGEGDSQTTTTRYLSVATGKGSITLMGTSTGESAVSIGHAAYAVGDDSVALGSESKVADKEGSAIGSGAISYSKGASALGAESEANGEQSTAVGYYSVANGANATSLGSGSIAYNEGSLALGAFAKTGYYTYDEATKVATLVEGDYGKYATAMGYYANAVGNFSVAIGYGAMAGYTDGGDINMTSATAVGLGAGALGDTSTALGAGTMVQAGANASMAVGTNAFVLKDKKYATALGYEAQAQEEGAFAIGYQAVAATEQTVENKTTGAEASTGDIALVSTVSFGHQAEDGAYKIPEGGTTYEFEKYGTVALSRLTNIAVGKSDTDAVNFGQIKIVAPSGTTYLTSSLDANGNLNENGTIGANLIALDKAIVALDTKVGGIETTIGNVQLDTTGLEFDFSGGKTDDTQTIKYTDGNGNAKTFDITIKGISGGGSGGTTYTAGNGIKIDTSETTPTISVKVAENGGLTADANGLAVQKDGKVEAGNTGLVTGGTVYDALKNMDNQVSELSDDIHKVGAGAAALAALRPEAFDPADKWSFAVGYGHYKNANAGALGAFFKPNADMTVSIGGTIGNGDPMLNAGLSFKLGQRSAKLPQNATNPQLVQEVNTLRAQNATQQQEISAQRQEITSLRADNQRMRQQIEMILSKLDMSGKVSRTAK